MKLFIFGILILCVTNAAAQYDPFAEQMEQLGYEWNCETNCLKPNFGKLFLRNDGIAVVRTVVCQDCRFVNFDNVVLNGKECVATSNNAQQDDDWNQSFYQIPIRNTKLRGICDCTVPADTARIVEFFNLPEIPLRKGHCQVRSLNAPSNVTQQQLIQCFKENGVRVDANKQLIAEQKGKFNFEYELSEGTIFVQEMSNETRPHYFELVIEKSKHDKLDIRPFYPTNGNAKPSRYFLGIARCLFQLNYAKTLFHLAMKRSKLCPMVNGADPGLPKPNEFPCNTVPPKPPKPVVTQKPIGVTMKVGGSPFGDFGGLLGGGLQPVVVG